MKQSVVGFYTHLFFIRFIAILPLALAGQVAAFGVGTFILPRSQTVNAARELVCWQREINRPHGCTDYWSLSLAGEYDRAFNTGRIADYLLGGPILSVEGSAYGPCQSICGTTILADYVGLPRDFKSRVRIACTLACLNSSLAFCCINRYKCGCDSIKPIHKSIPFDCKSV